MRARSARASERLGVVCRSGAQGGDPPQRGIAVSSAMPSSGCSFSCDSTDARISAPDEPSCLAIINRLGRDGVSRPLSTDDTNARLNGRPIVVCDRPSASRRRRISWPNAFENREPPPAEVRLAIVDIRMPAAYAADGSPHPCPFGKEPGMPKRFMKIRSVILAASSAFIAILATVSTALADSGGGSFP